ncbi:MAG: hypothetical protein HYV63_29005 [Candidatus Schekmanbacteria bacterium]|nr:hypothetical protein [Candidatus Schekmanbacteria bacterium]
MEIANELLRVALLGTERQPLPWPEQAADGLGRLLSALDAGDREGALLGAAGALAVYRRAGRVSATRETVPVPCPRDAQPRCSERAALHLAQMLEDPHKLPVLPEWLQALRAKDKRIPEEKLPPLLELGRRDRELRETLVPALGKRGAWLASLNPDWSYALASSAETGEDALEVWQTADTPDRQRLLRTIRREYPDRARKLVESTWKEDPPEERAAFLAELRTGLSMADEPLLEEALDDRRKEVRQAAIDLLARLPESRLVRRMSERVLPLIAIPDGEPATIEVRLPEASDKAMQRDGVALKPTADHGNLGEKAFWLLQMLRAVPPSHWSHRRELPPERLLDAADRSEWKEVLMRGWAEAAARFRSPGWAEAMLLRADALQDGAARAPLLEALPPAQQQAVLLELMPDAHRTAAEHQGWVALLRACERDWSSTFAEKVVAHSLGILDSRYGFHLEPALSLCSLTVPPSLYPTVAAQLGEGSDDAWGWRSRAVEKFLVLLRFRWDMLQALEE